MAKMTIFHLGVIIFAICLSTQQVLSQNNTTPADTNSTSSPMNSTMVTPTSGNGTNSTLPTGAGVSVHAGTFSSLMPLMAVGLALIQRFC